MGEESLTVWTVGHSTRSLGEFFELLATHKIEAVADVRRFAASRKHPQFNQDAIRHSLVAIGVEYVPLPELGGRRRPRPNSPNTAWRNESFRGYADYMESDDFRAGIEQLLILARRKRTAVMCAEAVWWRCHRSLIADYLKAAGVRVRHILGPDKSVIHPFSSAANLRDGRLTYSDVGDNGRRTTVARKLKVGDHVTWNSEAGHVSGKIIKVHSTDFDYKGYTHHASKEDPQYEIQSDKTDHIAVHKASALRKVGR